MLTNELLRSVLGNQNKMIEQTLIKSNFEKYFD